MGVLIPYFVYAEEYDQTGEDALAVDLLAAGATPNSVVIRNTTLEKTRFWNGSAFENAPLCNPDGAPWSGGGGGAITGEIKMWPTTTAPSGYLNCDGAAVSRTTYADLFAVVGTAFGVGDGSTTFNLPPKGRAPVGIDDTQTEFDTIGKTGGAKTHTLTEAEMPAHVHDEYNNSATTGGLAGWAARDTSTNTPVLTDYDTGSKGGGQAHNNLQPYFVLNFIIKT